MLTIYVSEGESIGVVVGVVALMSLKLLVLADGVADDVGG